MKTTDRKEIKKGQYYYLVLISLGKIKRVKCTHVNQPEKYRGITSWCYLSIYSHQTEQFHRESINGRVYWSQGKAKQRLIKLIKNNIKYHKNAIIKNEKILETLDAK